MVWLSVETFSTFWPLREGHHDSCTALAPPDHALVPEPFMVPDYRHILDMKIATYIQFRSIQVKVCKYGYGDEDYHASPKGNHSMRRLVIASLY